MGGSNAQRTREDAGRRAVRSPRSRAGRGPCAGARPVPGAQCDPRERRGSCAGGSSSISSARAATSVWMQPPFYCDYGTNIFLGKRVFFNFNCVVLDVCAVRIGDFTLFGPVGPDLHRDASARGRASSHAGICQAGRRSAPMSGSGAAASSVRRDDRLPLGDRRRQRRHARRSRGVFAAGNPCRVIRAAVSQRLAFAGLLIQTAPDQRRRGAGYSRGHPSPSKSPSPRRQPSSRSPWASAQPRPSFPSSTVCC